MFIVGLNFDFSSYSVFTNVINTVVIIFMQKYEHLIKANDPHIAIVTKYFANEIFRTKKQTRGDAYIESVNESAI